jgi:hypothetical protein
MRARSDSRRIVVVVAAAGLLLAYAAGGEEARPGWVVDRGFSVFLTAARQKARISESLRHAGIQVVDDILDSPALLRATVGNEKGVRRCGTRNNVKYALRIGNDQLLELTAAGWTGTCEPNVFDELSAKLARALSDTNQGESP